jgi:ribosomal-protein-alanine N-acetyltransferase
MIEDMKLAPPEIATPRLRLRRLRSGDLDAFAAMNADEQVMEFFPRPWSFEESKIALERVEKEFTERGFGIYAVALQNTLEFAGVVGLSIPSFEAHFTPCVEILWRLIPRYWRNGFASEAANAVLNMAFQTLALQEVVAFAAIDNLKSFRVMEKIGMQRDSGGDFDHPGVAEPRLKQHALYRTAVLRT